MHRWRPLGVVYEENNGRLNVADSRVLLGSGTPLRSAEVFDYGARERTQQWCCNPGCFEGGEIFQASVQPRGFSLYRFDHWQIPDDRAAKEFWNVRVQGCRGLPRDRYLLRYWHAR